MNTESNQVDKMRHNPIKYQHKPISHRHKPIIHLYKPISRRRHKPISYKPISHTLLSYKPTRRHEIATQETTEGERHDDDVSQELLKDDGNAVVLMQDDAIRGQLCSMERCDPAGADSNPPAAVDNVSVKLSNDDADDDDDDDDDDADEHVDDSDDDNLTLLLQRFREHDDVVDDVDDDDDDDDDDDAGDDVDDDAGDDDDADDADDNDDDVDDDVVSEQGLKIHRLMWSKLPEEKQKKWINFENYVRGIENEEKTPRSADGLDISSDNSPTDYSHIVNAVHQEVHLKRWNRLPKEEQKKWRSFDNFVKSINDGVKVSSSSSSYEDIDIGVYVFIDGLTKDRNLNGIKGLVLSTEKDNICKVLLFNTDYSKKGIYNIKVENLIKIDRAKLSDLLIKLDHYQTTKSFFLSKKNDDLKKKYDDLYKKYEDKLAEIEDLKKKLLAEKAAKSDDTYTVFSDIPAFRNE
jgi:hypothetical protein